ncbi:glycosyltransferase family 2 protein [Butyrivibrio sp. AD3002]|uniref:glycosyltransferase family 2 protein n=1 Tax=Butyrivibrio sp. AD3002 TaxID=1280670 RepID=UPI0003B4D110|nr:glycosyltransferase family 2 protein [Butyrivibrio sp. AD3002]
MKIISIVVPTYNEEDNVQLVYDRIKKIFDEQLTNYDFHLQFCDNCSTDNTQQIVREMANNDKRVQYIFYVKNFGFSKSTFYGLTQADGDCGILLFADLQDPPELIVDFVKEWEKGSNVVVGIKNKSKESKVVYAFRKLYYKIMKKITSVGHIEQFTGFGLYDKSVLDTFKSLNDPMPYLRGIVAELAPEPQRVFYTQKKREHGKSAFRFWGLYDLAMLGITSYSKALMRVATVLGVLASFASFVIAIITIILKISGCIEYPIGNAAILFGVYFIGGIILVFLGMLGEYISNINIRTMQHPIVIERTRYNFEVD